MSAKLLTVKQVAEQLSVAERTVLKWLNQGRMRGHNISGEGRGVVWRIRPAAVEQFLADTESAA